MATIAGGDHPHTSELNDRGNPSATSHVEYEDGTVAMVKKNGGSGRMSPVRARTMKEYEQQIAEMQKENFSLKLRIYFLEERMKKEWDGNGDDVHKINIELRVQVESLKQDLVEKQELLKKASNALDSVTAQQQAEIQQMCKLTAERVSMDLKRNLELTEQTIEELQTRLSDSHNEIVRLNAELSESGNKLHELLVINQALDARCRQLELAKELVEQRLEQVDGSSDGEEANSVKDTDVGAEGRENDKLIDQLRCALKAKDVIIEQLEAEKLEILHDTEQKFELQINKLHEKLGIFQQTQQDHTMDSPVESCRLSSQEFVASDINTSINTQELSNYRHQLQTFENQLTDARQTIETVENQLTDARQTIEHVTDDKQALSVNCRQLEAEINELQRQLELQDKTLQDKTELIKEMQESLERERQQNFDRMMALNAEYKILLENAAHQADIHDHTIEHLTSLLQQGNHVDHQHITTITHQLLAQTHGIVLAQQQQQQRDEELEEERDESSFVEESPTVDQSAACKVVTSSTANKSTGTDSVVTLMDDQLEELHRLRLEVNRLRTHHNNNKAANNSDLIDLNTSSMSASVDTSRCVVDADSQLVDVNSSDVNSSDVNVSDDLMNVNEAGTKTRVGELKSSVKLVSNVSLSDTATFERLERLVDNESVASSPETSNKSGITDQSKESQMTNEKSGNTVGVEVNESGNLGVILRESGNTAVVSCDSLEVTTASGNTGKMPVGNTIEAAGESSSCVRNIDVIVVDMKKLIESLATVTELEVDTRCLREEMEAVLGRLDNNSNTRDSLTHHRRTTDQNVVCDSLNQRRRTTDHHIVCDSTVADMSQSVREELQNSISQLAENDSSFRSQTQRESINVSRERLSHQHVEETTEQQQQLGTQNTENCLRSEIDQLKMEISRLNVELRRADNTASLLKRQIELNTRPEGSQSPGLNPELIVSLANEIERLNAELDKHRSSAAGGGDAALVASAVKQSPVRGWSPVMRKRSQIPVRAQSGLASSSLSMIGRDDELTGGTGRCGATSQRSPSKSDRQARSSSADCLRYSTSFSDHSLHEHLPTQNSENTPNTSSHVVGDTSCVQTPSGPSRIASLVNHTPFDTTSAVNRRAFLELQAEVERLRHRLELTELENSRLMENSRLLEQSARESSGSFLVADKQRMSEPRHSVGDMSVGADISLLSRCSATGEVTLAAGFLKKLIEAHKRDRGAMQHNLAKSHETCRLLRTRMEELLGFLQDLLVVTPPQGGATERTSRLLTRITETRNLLADVTSDLAANAVCDDVSLEVSDLEFELSALTDMDITVNESTHQVTRASELDSELKDLYRQREALQLSVSELTQKLLAAENETFLTRCRNSELSRDLESTTKQLTAVSGKLSSYQQLNVDLNTQLQDYRSRLEEVTMQLSESRSRVDEVTTQLSESRSRVDELMEGLRKTSAKKEELIRVKRELQTALIEQEKHVTECELKVKQLTTDSSQRNNEIEALRRTLTEQRRTITALTDDRTQLLDKISAQDDVVRQLRDELERERSLSVTRDDRTRSGMQDRDGMIAKLKALLRENQATADRLKDELRRMNDEVEDKNKTISRLRHACRDLSTRCGELEVVVCQLSSDPEASLNHSAGCSEAQSAEEIVATAGKRGSSAEVSLELIRQALDFDDQLPELDDVDVWRRRHGSSAQVSVVSLPTGATDRLSDVSRGTVTAEAGERDLTRSRSLSELTEDGNNWKQQQVEDGVSESGTRCYHSDDNQLEVENNVLYTSLCTCRQQLVTVELELKSLRQRLEESTAINHALRLELQLTDRVTRDDDKENINNGGSSTSMNNELSGLLSEIHNLRLQLERCITSNDSLRQTLSVTTTTTTQQQQQQQHELFTATVTAGNRNMTTTSTNTDNVDIAVEVGGVELELNVVGRRDVLEQLKLEIERCHDNLRQLEASLNTDTSSQQQQQQQQVQRLWKSLQQLRTLLASFRLVPATTTTGINTDSSVLRTENESLRRQLSELRQRYTRVKQTLKSAQERIDTNNRKKEELLHTQHKKNEQAIIEQINKTRQVLAQTTHNLETVHRQTEH